MRTGLHGYNIAKILMLIQLRKMNMKNTSFKSSLLPLCHCQFPVPFKISSKSVDNSRPYILWFGSSFKIGTCIFFLLFNLLFSLGVNQVWELGKSRKIIMALMVTNCRRYHRNAHTVIPTHTTMKCSIPFPASSNSQ